MQRDGTAAAAGEQSVTMKDGARPRSVTIDLGYTNVNYT